MGVALAVCRQNRIPPVAHAPSVLARVWQQVQVAHVAVLHPVALVLARGKLAALLPAPVGRCVAARVEIALVAVGGGGGLLAGLLWLVYVCLESVQGVMQLREAAQE
eukprot:6183842-Ditylum_brightwellii.AAC.1